MRYIIAAVALLGVACAPGVRDFELPSWTEPVVSERSSPVPLHGEWILNESLSDDPEPLIKRAVERLRKSRRDVIGESGRGRERGGSGIRVAEAPDAPASPDPYRDAAVSDPRLAILRAKSVIIEQAEDSLRFTFDGAPAVGYRIGQATSEDQNINLTFADWEGSQFVVEKNGPDGLVLERWILSPDRSRLYVAVSLEIKLPDFPLPEEPVLIGRMFDRRR